MDNASTDETVTLLKDYKNSGYISFYSAPDTGKFDALNKGLLRAKGKYVAFLSCDDFYHDITGIYDVVNLMEANDAVFCYFPAYCILPDNSAMLFNPSIYSVFQAMPFPRQAAIFKREALEKIGYFDAKFKLFADYDLILRLVLSGMHGIQFDGNIVTYKFGVQAQKYSVQVAAECSHIYHKNLRALYPLNEIEIEKMVKISEIPQPLLNQLAKYFPEEDYDLFIERYTQMYEMRLQAAEAIRAQERRPL
jgi:glycosyltransferase involved in cell wall biosynthesis